MCTYFSAYMYMHKYLHKTKGTYLFFDLKYINDLLKFTNKDTHIYIQTCTTYKPYLKNKQTKVKGAVIETFIDISC